MPVCEDDDLCVCGHIRLEHYEYGVKSDACTVEGCGCADYRDDHAKKIERWACGYCKTEYSTKEEALVCGESRTDPRFAIGDVVIDTSRSRYGWFDGDSEWIAGYKTWDDNGELRPVDKSEADLKLTVAGHYQYSFYYVVIMVEKRHGACGSTQSYLIETGAMSAKKGHRVRSCQEYFLEKAETVPEKIAEEAARVKKTVTFT